MLWPLCETLKIIEPLVPSQIVSPQAYSQSQHLATLLPQATSSCYWECRLTADAPQVDFLTCVAAYDNGREVFSGKQEDNGLSPVFTGAPVWDNAQSFFSQWADPISPLYDGVPLIWLEFDHVESALPHVPLPSFSFCVDPLYAERRSWEQYVKARNPHYRQQMTEHGLPLFLGQPLSPQTAQALRTCFEVLPAGSRLIHLSAMVARQPSVVKLYGSVPRTQLLSYLKQIGWAGSVPELTDILATFCTPETVDDTMYIDLSLGETVLPRLGIAFAQQQIPNLPSKDPSRRMLLDLCEQNGLCSAEKREALLAWAGSSLALFSGEKRPTKIHRWLDIKFVYDPGSSLEAKGYLGFMPHLSLF
jgi:hypothetical protein